MTIKELIEKYESDLRYINARLNGEIEKGVGLNSGIHLAELEYENTSLRVARLMAMSFLEDLKRITPIN